MGAPTALSEKSCPGWRAGLKANGSRIERTVAEKSEQAAMKGVGSGFGDNVDRRAAGSAQLRRVVVAVDLKLVDRILADRKAHAAGIVIGLAAVYGYAAAPAVAAVDGKSALRGRLHAVVVVAGDDVRVAHTGHQQRKGEVVALADRQVFNQPRADRTRLAAAFSFDHWRSAADDHLRAGRRDGQGEIVFHRMPYADHDSFAENRGKTGRGG